MTEIEDKRKEAIELVARYKFVENKMTAEQVAGHILNLGKEMARKEFLDKFDKWLISKPYIPKSKGLPDRVISFKDYSKFKQSLYSQNNEKVLISDKSINKHVNSPDVQGLPKQQGVGPIVGNDSPQGSRKGKGAKE